MRIEAVSIHDAGEKARTSNVRLYTHTYTAPNRPDSFVFVPTFFVCVHSTSLVFLAVIHCSMPTIDWISIDSTSVGDVSGIRRVLRNGTLVLLPFSAAAYRQDVHNTIYRCVASNSIGRIISRDVQVRAGELETNGTGNSHR